MNAATHYLVTAAGTAEVLDRKSRFLTELQTVADETAVRRCLAELRRQHPKATHHVFAWRLLDAATERIRHRFDDDGEPGGTAGRPVLQQLEAHDLVDALCVVVRYFGGIKLGAGGLVRAYSRSAAAAIAAAAIAPLVRYARVRVRVPFDQLSVVEALIAREALQVVGRTFAPEPEFLLAVPAADLGELRRKVREATAGRGVLGEE